MNQGELRVMMKKQGPVAILSTDRYGMMRYQAVTSEPSSSDSYYSILVFEARHA